MRINPLVAVLAVAVAGACGKAPTAPESFSLPVQVTTGEAAAASAASHTASNSPQHHTHLTGQNEVPARDSKGQGQAIFRIAPDGQSITYKLNVANIENVTQSHIHLAPAGSNGGIVVWLYPSAPPMQLIPGRFQGTLGEGVITADSLVNALAGQPLSALIDAIEDGNAYVNVHTVQFPPGEIRGQID